MRVVLLNIIILFAILSYGENMIGNQSVHAEHNAMNKLEYNKKRFITVDIIIIRISKGGLKLCTSLPCKSCMYKLSVNLPNKGYKIKTMYYSNQEGTIECTNFNDVIDDSENHHITKLQLNKGTKKCLI